MTETICLRSTSPWPGREQMCDNIDLLHHVYCGLRKINMYPFTVVEIMSQKRKENYRPKAVDSSIR